MRLIIFIALLFVTANLAWGQAEKFNVVIPSPESESSYVWQNIRDIKFFDSNGYSISRG